jgi:ABC-type branched-subunit amino acid transport system substrate-binding protein
MRKTGIIVGVVLLLSACGGVGGKANYPDALTPEAQQAWNEAESFYHEKQFGKADSAYKNFIETYGYNSLTDDARFKRGEISFNNKNYAQALDLYRSACSNIYSPTVTPRAQFKAAYSLYLLKRYSETADELTKTRRRDASAVLRVRTDSLGILTSRALKEGEGSAIKYYLFLFDDYSDLGSNRQGLEGVPDVIPETEATSVVRSWVGNDDVTSVQVYALPLKEFKGKTSGAYAQFKLGKTLNREGDFGRASKELRAYTSAYPKHEYYGAAQAMLGETAGRAGEAKVKVGLIVPLSGKYGIYGESVQHGVECAAGVFSPCEGPEGVSVLIRDADGEADKITAAVDDLAASNVIAIIGPMLSSTVTAAAERAQQLQVPMVTLSQKAGTNEIGDYIFRNTVAAGSQVSTIVDYAVGRKHLKRFLVLYPQNEQGREYKELFSDALKRAGGRVVAANGYSSSRVEFASDIRSLQFATEGEKSYDAIFIPDSFGPAGYLATTLAMMGIEGVPYFGISRWDDPRLISAGGKYVEGAVFPEAFYKKSSDPAVSGFVQRFTQAYGIEPTLLEALGYDSMQMILEAVKMGSEHRGTLKDSLSRMTEFQGVTGKTSFGANRDASRELPLLTVSGGEIRPLK